MPVDPADLIAEGESYASVKAKLIPVVERWLGAGSASGGNTPTTWGDMRSRLNVILTSFNKPTISNGEVGSSARDKINTIIDTDVLLAGAVYPDLSSYADFNNGIYWVPVMSAAAVPTATVEQLTVKRPGTFEEWFAFTCSSTTARSYTDVNGVLRNDLAADQPRFDWINGRRQLALNGPFTNVIRNNTMAGAAPGSPGTFPTLWQDGFTAIARQVVGVGTENGVDYIDLRFAGVPTDTGPQTCRMDITSTASAGETWTNSVFVRLQAGSLTNVDLTGFVLRAGNEGGGTVFTPDSTLRHIINTRTLTGTNQMGALRWNYIDTVTPVDFTLRIGLPQCELGTFASPPIKTAGAAVTRAIETAELSPVLEAILQRSAASVVVRGQNLLRAQGMMLGVNGGNALLRSATGRTTAVIDGSGSLVSGGGVSFEASKWAAASAFDATGRSVIRNGGTVTTDAGTPPATRTAAYLGRNGSGTLYGDGWFDFVGIAPSRLSDARLTELAVAA